MLWETIPGAVAPGTVLVIVAGRRRHTGTTCGQVDLTALIRSADLRAGRVDRLLPGHGGGG